MHHSSHYHKSWSWLAVLIIAVIGLIFTAVVYQNIDTQQGNSWIWLVFGLFLILLLIAIGLYICNLKAYQFDHSRAHWVKEHLNDEDLMEDDLGHDYYPSSHRLSNRESPYGNSTRSMSSGRSNQSNQSNRVPIPSPNRNGRLNPQVVPTLSNNNRTGLESLPGSTL